MAERNGGPDGGSANGDDFRFDDNTKPPTDNGGNPKDNGGNPPKVDLAAASDNGNGEPGKRKRGRPSGSGNKSKPKAQAPLDIDFVQISLLSIHTMLASLVNVPELELTDDEAAKLAKAVHNVSRYYPVSIDPKAQAWFGLATAAGSIYGTRLFAVMARKKAEQAVM